MIFNENKLKEQIISECNEYVSNEKDYLLRQFNEKIDMHEKHMYKVLNECESAISVLTERINGLEQAIIQSDPIDEIKINSIVENLESQIKDSNADNKELINIINIVNDSLQKLNDRVTQKSESPKATHNTSIDEIKILKEKTKSLQENINDLKKSTETYVEVILEKLADKIIDLDALPDELKKSECPFIQKKGFCELWANRTNKQDGLVYCTSCIRKSELLQKGIKL